MTDDPALTPGQDAVRRLLADARHDGSTPPEVVARLDARLASLVSERADAPLPGDRHGASPTPVADLGARRRRVAGIGLLAAAAVVVAGVAVGQGLPRLSGGQSDSGSSAGSDMATSQDRGPSEDDGGADAGSSAAEVGPGSLKSTAAAPEAALPTLSSTAADLDDDLLDLRGTDTPRTADLASPGRLSGCDLRGTGRGRRLLAEVDGREGAVVFRRPDDGDQRVDLYVCGTSVPVRTLTLPAP